MTHTAWWNGAFILVGCAAIDWVVQKDAQAHPWATLLYAGIAWAILGGAAWIASRYRVRVERRPVRDPTEGTP